jgi:hypothetical protein
MFQKVAIRFRVQLTIIQITQVVSSTFKKCGNPFYFCKKMATLNFFVPWNVSFLFVEATEMNNK